jgi:hypothetical protein
MAVFATKSLGMLFLAVYLIVVGLLGMAPVGIPAIVAAVLALIAGILLLLGR